MLERIDKIRDKLSNLKKLDQNLEVFGAQKHRFELNKVKSEKELLAFEKEHNITLPQQYRAFLAHIGNGGAGPYLGLEPLDNGRFMDLDYKQNNDLIDLSKPFPHSENWNMQLGEYSEESEKEYSKKEEEYFDPKWVSGALRVSNFGCGVSLNIIVNGSEYGNIWVDDRCNDQGIYSEPLTEKEERVTFFNWYESWLDKQLKDLKEGNIVLGSDKKLNLMSKLRKWRS